MELFKMKKNKLNIDFNIESILGIAIALVNDKYWNRKEIGIIFVFICFSIAIYVKVEKEC